MDDGPLPNVKSMKYIGIIDESRTRFENFRRNFKAKPPSSTPPKGSCRNRFVNQKWAVYASSADTFPLVSCQVCLMPILSNEFHHLIRSAQHRFETTGSVDEAEFQLHMNRVWHTIQWKSQPVGQAAIEVHVVEED